MRGGRAQASRTRSLVAVGISCAYSSSVFCVRTLRNVRPASSTSARVFRLVRSAYSLLGERSWLDAALGAAAEVEAELPPFGCFGGRSLSPPPLAPDSPDLAPALALEGIDEFARGVELAGPGSKAGRALLLRPAAGARCSRAALARLASSGGRPAVRARMPPPAPAERAIGIGRLLAGGRVGGADRFARACCACCATASAAAARACVITSFRMWEAAACGRRCPPPGPAATGAGRELEGAKLLGAPSDLDGSVALEPPSGLLIL